jgi:hypothetical protein
VTAAFGDAKIPQTTANASGAAIASTIPDSTSPQ